VAEMNSVALKTARGEGASSWRPRRLLLGVLLSVIAAALPAPAAAGAVPPQYPNAWGFAASGLRQLRVTTDTRAFCKGPSGSVYEVALSQRISSNAVIARVRLSDGAVLKSWTYPATPGVAGYIPRAAASDSQRNLFVAVESLSGTRDWLVVKFSPAGKRLWTRRYDSGNGSDVPYGMVVDHHGNVIVVGTSQGRGSGGYDGAVVKWSSAGAFKWKHVISSRGRDLFKAVAVDAADNVYVSGQLGSGGPVFARAALRAYTPAGRLRWTAGAKDTVRDLSFTYLVVRGSGVYVAGVAGTSPSSAELLAAKYTVAGTRAWSGVKVRSYAPGSRANGLAVDRSGAALVVGVAYAAGGSGQNLGAVWKLTPKGGTAWYREFNNSLWPHDGRFDAVGIDSKNRVYVAGGVYVSAATANLLMVRYSPGGSEQAMWRSDGQQSGGCAFSNVLVLSDTQVLAAGRVSGNGANAAVYRAKTTP